MSPDDTPTLTDSPQIDSRAQIDEIDIWWEQANPVTGLPDLSRVPALDAYDNLILDASARTGVPAAMIKAVCVAESRMNPRAVSHAGARGLMQLMPGTAQRLGVTDTFDAEQSIDGGSRYLSKMRADFGTWELAVAAYNAGPGAVRAHNGIPPYQETRTYVGRVMRLYDYFRTERPVIGHAEPG